MTICFVDTETSGLDPDRHEVWEIAVIVRDHYDSPLNGEWAWQLWPDLTKADPTGLRVGQFYRRQRLTLAATSTAPRARASAILTACPWWGPEGDHTMRGYEVTNLSDVAPMVAFLLDGATLVGAVPDFDARFLTRFLNRHGHAATWHYHLQDVETLAAGFLRGRGEPVEYPYRSDEISRRCGVEPPGPDERHTALGDARWAQRLWDYIMAGGDVS